MTGPAELSSPVATAEALATFERWYAAHETGHLAGLADVLAPDVTVHSMFRPAPARGHDEALAHFRHTMSVFPDLRMPLVSGPAATQTGAVLAEVRFVGRFAGRLTWAGDVHRGTGEAFEVPGAIVVHTRNRAVTVVRTLFDRDDWLRQIGVLAA